MGNSYEGVKDRENFKRDESLQNQMILLEKLVEELKLTPDLMRKIAYFDVSELVAKLNSREVTSTIAVVSVCYRTSTVGKRLNLFTFTNFEQALNMAAKCDEIRKQKNINNWVWEDGEFIEGKHLPPLFGVPFSVKDVYDMKGFPTNLGLLSENQIKEKDCAYVACLKNSGMIPFVRSNIPQFGMYHQTVNNLWGRSLNPWNKLRAVGGSSGGEAGLVASRCSYIGIGSDIGGSIRIPSEFCGVMGLKCFSKRISPSYHASFSKAFTSFGQNIPLSQGPIGRSAKDLALFMKIVTTQAFFKNEDDPYVKIVPFDDQLFIKTAKCEEKLKIGYYKSLIDIQPSPASVRGLQQVLIMLQNEGHQIVQISVPHERELIREFFVQLFSNGGKAFRQILKKQKPIDEYKEMFFNAELWGPGRGLVSVIAKMLMPRLHYYFMEKCGNLSTFQYQKHAGSIVYHRKEWAQYWKENNLDFVITPGFGCQALRHGESPHSGIAAAYTLIWNVLDMTVGSLPVTVVEENEQYYNSKFNDYASKELSQNAKNTMGLPVGIQIVGLPYQEERVLGLMSFIEQKIKFNSTFPVPSQ